MVKKNRFIIILFIAFVCALIYGIRRGFSIWFPVITMGLFAPTIFIFYNSSAWVYIVIYGVVVLIGNTIGMVFYKVKEKQRDSRR